MIGYQYKQLISMNEVTPDFIAQTIETAVVAAVHSTVPPTVERVVNGKINKVQKTIDDHIAWEEENHLKMQSFMEALMPVKEGVQTIQTINKFLKWVGIPSLIAALYWFFDVR